VHTEVEKLDDPEAVLDIEKSRAVEFKMRAPDACMVLALMPVDANPTGWA
jgi:hypothetical protein